MCCASSLFVVRGLEGNPDLLQNPMSTLEPLDFGSVSLVIWTHHIVSICHQLQRNICVQRTIHAFKCFSVANAHVFPMPAYAKPVSHNPLP